MRHPSVIKSLFILIIFLISLSPEHALGNDEALNEAKKTVVAYFDYYASNPLGGHGFREDIIHPDYEKIGLSSQRFCIIQRPIAIGKTQRVSDVFNLAHPRKENAIEVTVTVEQIYIVDGFQVIAQSKSINLHFILSNYGLPPMIYRIIHDDIYSFNYAFEDEMRKALIKEEDETSVGIGKLKKSFIKAGMKGL